MYQVIFVRVQVSLCLGLCITEIPAGRQHGYFEIRAQVPAGKGLWSASWLMPEVVERESLDMIAQDV